MNEDVLKQFAQALAPYMGQKATGSPVTSPYLYESGGLFGRCDGPSQLINALVGPIGYEKALNWYGNSTQYEFVDALAAVAESGSEQSSACGDCVKLSTKACSQFYCFGRFCRQTDELLFDQLGLKANPNVPIKTLFGSITDPSGNEIIGSGEVIRDDFYLQSRLVGYGLRLKNAEMLWTGNVVNSNKPAYVEYMGLDIIVNSGKYDSYTQLDCDSIDPFLMDFGFNNPTASGSYAITNWFRRAILQLHYRAMGANMDWDSAAVDIAMTPNMWDCVAKAYSCAGVDLCGLSGTNPIMNASADQAQARYEEYLNRQALPIYGRWFPVVLDNMISETPGQANGTCSDIYILTKNINGEEVLYGEYQDFNQTYGAVRQELVSMFGSDDIAITDNGRFALVRSNERGCFDLQAVTKPRIVAKTPWLNARIQNVCCDMLQEPLPDVSGSGRVYENDGGRTTTPIPTLYGDCLDC